jgi:polysaccharide biosynthesis protein PslH
MSRFFDVDLLALQEENDDAALAGLEGAFRKVHLFTLSHMRSRVNAFRGFLRGRALQQTYYALPSARKWLEAHAYDYDGLFVNHVRMAPYAHGMSLPAWVDLHDAISYHYASAMHMRLGGWNIVYRYEYPRVLKAELEAIRRFDRAFIVSARDRDFLVHKGADAGKIIVAPVAVSPEVLERPATSELPGTLCFIGKMDTVANDDAARWFCAEVFPALREKRADVKMMIVGAHPSPAVKRLASIPGVTVTGWVRNPHELVGKAAVVVAPMRIGAGMQNKVLEAMALRKPVVVSPLAAEGIGAAPGEHFLVADRPNEWRSTILALLDDPQRRTALGDAARTWILRYHSWDTLGELFAAEMNATLPTS